MIHNGEKSHGILGVIDVTSVMVHVMPKIVTELFVFSEQTETAILFMESLLACL